MKFIHILVITSIITLGISFGIGLHIGNKIDTNSNFQWDKINQSQNNLIKGAN